MWGGIGTLGALGHLLRHLEGECLARPEDLTVEQLYLIDHAYRCPPKTLDSKYCNHNPGP